MFLLVLVGCSDNGPSDTVALAQKYAYSNHLTDQSGALDCQATGLLTFDPPGGTLLHANVCQGVGPISPVTTTLIGVSLDGNVLTFDADECVHTGTVSGDRLQGTIECPETISGTWSADSVPPNTTGIP
jgi:hypothetical protein